MFMLRQVDGIWTVPAILSKSIPSFSIDIILDSADLPHVVWTGQQLGFFYSHMISDGRWTPVYDFSGGTYAYHFSLMIDKNDQISLVWNDTRWEIGKQAVYFAQRNSQNMWSAPEKVSNSIRPLGEVEAAILGGDICTVWTEETELNTDLYYSCRNTSIWSLPVQITNTPIYSLLPHMVFDPMGAVGIAWNENDNMGQSSLYFMETQPLHEDGTSLLSQSLTVPISITNPTLSFLADLSGVSPISGNEFQVQVSSGITTTTLFTTTTPTPWEHFWFELTPWSGQQITLTFKLTENAGFPPANALLDEVTLGSAHPDVWVDLSSDAPSAIPGEQFNFQLDYGNRGHVSAFTPVITLTLPSGLNFVSASVTPEIIADQLVWHLDDLLKQSGPNSITLTVEVDSAVVLGQKVVTLVEITSSSPELEKLNNNSQVGTFLGYLGILPLINR